LQFTEEQIFNLAPDEASKKAGRDLATASKWVSKGFTEEALWGECQGSGSKPYQTQIDLRNIAFKCSCPSRKFPCKHGLGLLLYKARQPNDFSISTMPAWVEDWINKRVEKQTKQEEKVEKPVDEAARAKRQQVREQRVTDGIEEVQRWIKDIVRNGILNMPEKGYTWFEAIAKRMVDAQAPGVAGMIRSLGETNFYSEGWQSRFMDQLVSIYLVTKAFENSEGLSEELKQDVRNWIGFTQNQEELKEQTGITDTWLVLAKQVSENDNITTERFWLYGTATKQFAVVLQFIVRGQGGQLTLMPGLYIQAELVFFPSVLPMRAIIKRQIAAQAIPALQPMSNWTAVAETETSYNSLLPVRSERPYLVSRLKTVFHNNQWWLQDTEMNLLQLRNRQQTIWKLLAVSGGVALDMALIGREDSYEAVGVWQNGEYKAL
jgi:hypothetical protein